MNTDLKRFGKAFLFIMLAVFAADYVVGSALKYLYNKQSSGILYRANYAIDSTKADILVFGSSRANHHYNPKVFEDSLHHSFYNCGKDGQGLVYTCAIISAITERYKPKFIIIDIRPDEFSISDHGKLSPLFPYHENKAISPFFNYDGGNENIKFISHIYPYNSLLTNLIVGVSQFNKKRTADYKGYLALKETKEKDFKVYKETGNVDMLKVRYFKDAVLKLSKLHIPAMVIISPMYGNVIDGATVSIAQNICSGYNSIKFINFTHQPVCGQAQYFNDWYHLNENGSTRFSKGLISKIRAVL